MRPANSPNFDILGPTNAARLAVLRASVEPILANNLSPELTDHSIKHSDYLVGLIHDLIDPIQSSVYRLSHVELVVLFSACYLHDIGIQYGPADRLDVIPTDDPRQRWADLSEATKRDLRRKYHHCISAKMIYLSSRSTAPLVGLQLTDDYYPAQLACLCEAHGLDPESHRYQEIIKDSPGLRLGLLSGLLRVADILDESQHRAVRDRARTLELPLNSQTHWWRHYYTEAVSFDQDQMLITVHFDLPRDKAEEYRRVVPELQLPYIKDEFAKHEEVFSRNGLRWRIDCDVDTQEYGNKEAMPDDVLTAMLKHLRQRTAREAEAQRAADLEAFRQAQPLLRRQYDQIQSERPSLSAADYLRRLYVLAQHRRDLGSKRAAAMMLLGPFEQDLNHLPDQERVRIGIDLARWLYDEEFTFQAVEVLGKIQGTIVQPTVQADLTREFWHLASECLNAEARHIDAGKAMHSAATITLDQGQRESGEAQLAEWSMLHGNFQLIVIPDVDLSADTIAQLCVSPTSLSSHAGQDATATSLIGMLSAPLRRILVTCKCLAMMGKADLVLAAIDASMPLLPPQDRLAHAALLLMKAEVLYLAGFADKAMQVYAEGIAALIDHLPSELALAVADNGTVLMAANQKIDSDDYYARFDEKRLRRFTTLDAEAIVAAVSAADNNEHYEAVPPLWREVCATYAYCNWQPHMRAHRWLAREYTKLAQASREAEFYVLATWHALMSLDDKQASVAGEAVALSQDPQVARAVVEKILAIGHLPRHARVACATLDEILDLIPDDLVSAVADWLLPFLSQNAGDADLGSRLVSAWKTAQALVPRLDDAGRLRIVLGAVKHPDWQDAGSVARKTLLHCVRTAVYCGIPDDAKEDIAAKTCPLVTSLKWDHDFAAAVELLVGIARNSGNDIREEIAAVLLPKGQEINNVFLLWAAPSLGRSIPAEDLGRIAEAAAGQIALQVQRILPTEDAKDLGGFCATRTHNGEKTCVFIHGGTQLLAVIAEQRQSVPDASVSKLIESILRSLQDPDNALSNRAQLIDALGKLSDRLSRETAERAVEALIPIANGMIIESSTMQSAAEAKHPLQRFRMGDTPPSAVRGRALKSLAYIEASNAGTFRGTVLPVFEAGLVDPDPIVRGWALSAACLLPQLSPTIVASVIVNTQDGDPDTAAAAWSALAKASTMGLAEDQWHGVLVALTKCQRSAIAEVRRAAAFATGRLLRHIGDGPLGHRLLEIRQTFASDACFSVRNAVARSDMSNNEDNSSR